MRRVALNKAKIVNPQKKEDLGSSIPTHSGQPTPIPPCSPVPTPAPPSEVMIEEDKKEEKMEVEMKPETINLDDVVKEKNKVIDLDETKKEEKPKKKYDLDDVIIRDVQLSNDVHIRLLSNMNGYFVDIRKFYRGYPSQKGIRIAAGRYALAYDYLKPDLDALNLPK